MEDQVQTRSRRGYRGCLFFPILLIVVGVILLLSNLNIISGSAWENIINAWPLLFVAWGLESLIRRDGLFGQTFLIGFGLVFLLSNYGILILDPWTTLLTIWPVLFIAIGLDIFLGHRRSVWLYLLGAGIAMIALFGAVYVTQSIALQKQAMRVPVEYGLQGADSAIVRLNPNAGTLKLSRLDEPDLLLKGYLPSNESGHVIKSKYLVENNTADLTITSGDQVAMPSTASEGQWQWDLMLTDLVPVELHTKMGAGQTNLDLTNLDLSSLDVEIGAGQSKVVLPEKGNFSGQINGAVGFVTIQVPRNAEVQIQADTALVIKTIPNGYVREGNLIKSPGYDTATERITLKVNLAVGWVSIVEK